MDPVAHARIGVFVVSHPRSGTHLLADFIRKNFCKFNRRLKPWESASGLLISLDDINWRDHITAQLHDRKETHLLLFSHFAGLRTATHQEAKDRLQPARSVFLYPFRRFSTTMKSYAEFRRFRGPVASFLGQPDDFFGLAETVKRCIELHADTWLQLGAHFIDVDRLAADPEATCRRLAQLFDEPACAIGRRLPRRKRLAGRAGELVERLTGRESTELRVTYNIPWQGSHECEEIDRQFAPLYSALSQRRIN